MAVVSAVCFASMDVELDVMNVLPLVLQYIYPVYKGFFFLIFPLIAYGFSFIAPMK